MMRGLVMVSVAALACLSGAPSVVGQSASPQMAGNVWVSGTVQCASWTAGDYGRTDGVYTMRGTVAHCLVSADDPRVSGPLTTSLDMDCLDDGVACASWGTSELVGPEGAWQGPLTGTVDPEGRSSTFTVFTGSGAYVGWTFVMHLVGPVAVATASMGGPLYEASLHTPTPSGPTR
jgi:hypothetical protein